MHWQFMARRGRQRVGHFRKGRVISYWPCDEMDRQALHYRWLGSNVPTAYAQGRGVAITAPTPYSLRLSKALTELDTTFFDADHNPQRCVFHSRATALGQPTYGYPWDFLTRSYLMLGAWKVANAGPTNIGGVWFDVFTGTTPGMLWAGTELSATQVEYTFTSVGNYPTAAVGITHGLSQGDTCKVALFWDHVARDWQGWLQKNSDAPATTVATSESAPTLPQEPVLGFRQDGDTDYFGQALIEFSEPPTNWQTVAQNILTDWVAGDKSLLRLNTELVFA